MLRNILQYTGQPPIIKGYLAPNVDSAAAEHPGQSECCTAAADASGCMCCKLHRSTGELPVLPPVVKTTLFRKLSLIYFYREEKGGGKRGRETSM